MASVEETEARIAARKAARDSAKEEQYAKDLEAYDALDAEHDGAVVRVSVERYVKGMPTFVVVKAPDPVQYKRFCDQVTKASEKNNKQAQRNAQDLLAESCWVYPQTPADRAAMLEHFPGLLLSIALKATKLVEGRAAEEGEG